MTAENLLSAYLDANILFIAAAAIWIVAKGVLSLTPLRDAFLTHLQMLYAVLLTVLLAPVIIFGFDLLRQMGLIAPVSAFNVSDFVVAQYLNGYISMAPTEFEKLLMLRSELTHDIATFSGVAGKAIGAFLLAGIGLYAARAVRDGWRISRLIKRSYILRRVGGVDVRVSHETLVPFSTRGLRRHYVILPTTLLSHANDVRVAVSHELQHMRQRDLVWELLLEFMKPFFFWNPAFRFWKTQVEKFRELACDQQVLQRNTLKVKDYCECVLRVCRNSVRNDLSNQLLTPSVPFAQLSNHARGSRTARFLKFRVLSMLKPVSRRPRAIYTGVLVGSLVCAVAATTLAARQTTDWSQDRLMLSAIVNLERLDTRNALGQ